MTALEELRLVGERKEGERVLFETIRKRKLLRIVMDKKEKTCYNPVGSVRIAFFDTKRSMRFALSFCFQRSAVTYCR